MGVVVAACLGEKVGKGVGRTDALGGSRGMGATAGKPDIYPYGGAGEGLLAEEDLAERIAGNVVESVDGLDVVALEKVAPEDETCSETYLLGRLEEEQDVGIGEVVLGLGLVVVIDLGKYLSQAQEGGRMAVVATFVRHAGVLRTVGKVGIFLDGKRVDIGTEGYGGRLGIGTPHGYDSVLEDIIPVLAHVLDETGGMALAKLLYDEIVGMLLLKGEFGMLVEVMAYVDSVHSDV